MDLGAPISYLVLESGTPVLSSDGQEVGRVEHVLADEEADVFDGLVVDMESGAGGLRFADAPQVAEIHERGVVLGLDAEQARALPEPSANPAVMDADPEDAEPEGLSGKLRRAWDLISGNY
jgi:sporulation protein YlmC with PRC-barrel domain